MKYKMCCMGPLAAQEGVPFYPKQAASLVAKTPIREFQVCWEEHVQEER